MLSCEVRANWGGEATNVLALPGVVVTPVSLVSGILLLAHEAAD
jgi:hypothetical protein